MPHSHYPQDIQLSNPPLIEAWLEIKWKLTPIDPPQIMKDEGYAFALGSFFASVKNRFPFREDLPSTNMPEQMLPHVVRHRFRVAEDGWPLVQIGPGIATVNYVKDYSWREFTDTALFLRKRLMEAYLPYPIHGQELILRYRNVHNFDYESENVLQFMRDQLNTTIILPRLISDVSQLAGYHPNSMKFNISFDLDETLGTGNIQIATAKGSTPNQRKDEPESKIIVWDLSVSSTSSAKDNLLDDHKIFENWLEAAHAVIHDWFFAIVDSELFEQYQ